MDDREQLLARIARLEALVVEPAARIAELEGQLRRWENRFTPMANVKPAAAEPR